MALALENLRWQENQRFNRNNFKTNTVNERSKPKRRDYCMHLPSDPSLQI